MAVEFMKLSIRDVKYPGMHLQMKAQFFLKNLLYGGTMDSPKEQIRKIKKGLPTQFFNDICKDLDLPETHLAKVIKASANNLAIRKKQGFFSFSESERLFRIRRIYNRALEVFEDEAVVKKWFKNPYWLLENAAPIDYLDTETGGREIEEVLRHIENGAFTFALPV